MNWYFHFWSNWEWPSLRGNGPEDLTSLLIVTIIASIVVPRIRRWWVRRAEDAKHEAAILHAKLDHAIKQNAHLIKHGGDHIPNVSHDGIDLTAPPELPKHPTKEN